MTTDIRTAMKCSLKAGLAHCMRIPRVIETLLSKNTTSPPWRRMAIRHHHIGGGGVILLIILAHPGHMPLSCSITLLPGENTTGSVVLGARCSLHCGNATARHTVSWFRPYQSECLKGTNASSVNFTFDEDTMFGKWSCRASSSPSFSVHRFHAYIVNAPRALVATTPAGHPRRERTASNAMVSVAAVSLFSMLAGFAVAAYRHRHPDRTDPRTVFVSYIRPPPPATTAAGSP